MGILEKVKEIDRKHFGDVTRWVRGEIDPVKALSQDFYYELYVLFLPEMPYGVAKAREGDPDQWIMDELEEIGFDCDVLRRGV